ncbi:hypothetical protein SDRG_08582 [Saprolegnia diclina VS20]|uniref:Protein ZIP4 homolog n=1 Tax=Saprolegnia diclina (strain VS20) TaxID=1156394 RepID=T0RU28_SAPDV|nr:hypothetical protein SDRG_08582 [Saprolegnia diclina VS20]EQC33902.1 hypothetical protein SDRG_08582 [Saprolegnia diclina VS20]|eukprot:XP_008612697.1 hypothetical protein SDRG_08582 [Saprolegnia diclina VS20]
MDLPRLARFLDGADEDGILPEARAWLDGPLHGVDDKDAIALYNKSRDCWLLETRKLDALQIRAIACIVMKRVQRGSMSTGVDLLRCFCRLGRLLLMCGDGPFPIATPQACFKEAIEIYRAIGVHKLGKVLAGVELEAVIDEVFQAFMGHLESLPLQSLDLDTIISDIQEIRMLLPYVPKEAPAVAKALLVFADSCLATDARDAESTLLAVALEIVEQCDRRRNKKLRAMIIGRLTDVYLDLELLDKAEACLRLLGATDGLLHGVKLYLKRQDWTAAANLVEKLQNGDDFDAAHTATRLFAHATEYAAPALDLWHNLQHNFPDAAWNIDADIANELAFSNDKNLRCQTIAIVERMVKEPCTSEQQARLKKVIHDGSCNAHNYNLHDEYFQWARIGMILSSTPEDQACSFRLMSRAKVKLGEFDDAVRYAHDALGKELSKKSLFACFRAHLAGPSPAPSDITELVTKLINLDDFDVYDLVMFAKEAHEAGSPAVVLQVLDSFSRMLVTHILQTGDVPQLPMGVLFQNMAQLNNSDESLDEDTSISNFMRYLRDLLSILDKIDPTQADTAFGPPSVFEWFYGVCHNLGCNKENWVCFMLAADVAVKAEAYFPNNTKLRSREEKCWLAASCIRMKSFDTLSDVELREVLATIEKSLSKIDGDGDTSRILDYLATSAFKINVKLLAVQGTEFVDQHMKHVLRTPEKLRELGDFVLYTSKQSLNEGAPGLLRPVASQLYKLSLQLELQKEKVDAATVTYPLKKIIALAQTKEEGYEWLHQARQIATSLEITLSDDDVEWLLTKAWNFGVSCYRNQELKHAEKFMTLSLAALEHSNSTALKKVYREKLQAQYSKLQELSHSHAA